MLAWVRSAGIQQVDKESLPKLKANASATVLPHSVLYWFLSQVCSGLVYIYILFVTSNGFTPFLQLVKEAKMSFLESSLEEYFCENVLTCASRLQSTGPVTTVAEPVSM